MAKRYELILSFTEGSLKGQRAKMTGDRLVLGSGEDADIRMDDPGVSRQHAVILYANNKYVIQDLHSVNGVFVDKKRIDRPTTLFTRSRVQIGAASIVMRIPGTKPRKKLEYKSEALDVPQDLGVKTESAAPKGLFKNKRMMIYIVGGLILLIFIFMMIWDPEEGEDGIGGPAGVTQARLLEEIEARQKALSEMLEAEAKREQERVAEIWMSPAVPDEGLTARQRQAQNKFEEGLRELRARNLLQAEQAFNVALSLDPNDMRASEYLTRTRRLRRGFALDDYELARQYFATLRYDLALTYFRRAMHMLEIEENNLDQESAGYIEVLSTIKAYIEQAEKLRGARP